MKKNKFIGSQLFMIVLALVLINVLAAKFYYRLDLTADKTYTLSKATKDILRSIDEPVTVKAYFTQGSQPEIEKARKDFQDLLIEYGNASKGMVNYAFLNPNEDEKLEQEAMQNGIQPLMLNVREKDQVKQQRVYLGAVVALGERTEVIPVIQMGAAMEYALSAAIKKLSVVNKPSIGYVTGHGEPALSAMLQVRQQLDVLYNVEDVNLMNESDDLNKYITIAIIAPYDSFSDYEFQRLDQYLAQGGNLFIAHNHVTANLQTLEGTVNTGNLSSWLANKGLRIENNFVIDQNCGTVNVQQQSGFMTYTTQIPFHYWPLVKQFPDIPPTKGLTQVVLQFASALSFDGREGLNFTPLLQSSENAASMQAPLFFDLQRNWTLNDFPIKNITLAGLLEGPIEGQGNSKIIVITDGDFAVNGEGNNMQQRTPDNIGLMANSIDWLSDDTGLIDLRTKEVSSRPLDDIEEGKRALLKWLNFLLPIILVIIYGLVRMQMNRNKRIKRMEAGYVQ